MEARRWRGGAAAPGGTGGDAEGKGTEGAREATAATGEGTRAHGTRPPAEALGADGSAHELAETTDPTPPVALTVVAVHPCPAGPHCKGDGHSTAARRTCHSRTSTSYQVGGAAGRWGAGSTRC